jgi:hypothetical protein
MVPLFEEPIKDEAPTRDIRTEDGPKPEIGIQISSSLENVTDVDIDDQTPMKPDPINNFSADKKSDQQQAEQSQIKKEDLKSDEIQKNVSDEETPDPQDQITVW